MFTNIANAGIANAGDAVAAAPSSLTSLLPMVLIFVVFYFLLIRPQMKKQKEVKDMVDSIKKGEKVIAAGGIIGKVVKIEDDIVHIEVATNTKIQALKASITDCLDRKTLKSAK